MLLFICIILLIIVLHNFLCRNGVYMKKRLIAIICTTLFAIPCIVGCSCSSLSSLSFSSAFNGGNRASVDYTETLTYDVTYDQSTYKKDSAITDEMLSVSFENGTYSMTLQVLRSKPTDIETDINPSSDTSFYSLTTQFSIDVAYTSNGKEYKRTDKINTLCYFYSNAFAPLYSKTTSSYSIVVLSKSAASFAIMDIDSTTAYNSTSYTVNTGYAVYDFDKDNDNDRPKIESDSYSQKTYKYESRTMIDNTELLFALRNFSVEKDKTSTLPVVSFGYGEYQSLSVKNTNETNREVTLNINDTDVTERISVKKYSYSINSSKTAGVSQSVVIQSAGENQMPNKALLLEFSSPLIIQASTTKYGGLLYTLKKVTYTT